MHEDRSFSHVLVRQLIDVLLVLSAAEEAADVCEGAVSAVSACDARGRRPFGSSIDSSNASEGHLPTDICASEEINATAKTSTAKCRLSESGSLKDDDASTLTRAQAVRSAEAKVTNSLLFLLESHLDSIVNRVIHNNHIAPLMATLATANRHGMCIHNSFLPVNIPAKQPYRDLSGLDNHINNLFDSFLSFLLN